MRQFCLVLVLCLCACFEVSASDEHKLKVVTTFLPMYCLAANVAGDQADVVNLLPPGAEPHDFQFSPREMKKLSDAAVVVENGLGLENWLDGVLRSDGGNKEVVKAGTGLRPQLIHYEKYMELAGGEEGTDATARGVNPHIWLDPVMAQHAVTNILMAMQKADLEHAGEYARNAARYISRLEMLDLDLRDGLAPLKGQAIITFHDAFAYFARRYGLRVVGVVEPVPDVPPSPRHLARLGKMIREQQVQVIFSEQESSSRLPEMMAEDYHVKVIQLDTLETGELSLDAYENGMRRNLAALKKAFP